MKQYLKTNQIILVLLLLVFISCNNKNFMKSKQEQFMEEKEKIDKILNEQKLTNYLRKLMMQNNDLIDKNIIFLDHEDFMRIQEDELNYSTMQINKEDDLEFKARMYAYKWGLLNNKSSMKLMPYSVKEDSESSQNWKSYLVLLMNSQMNVLQKVCFPTEIHENFAIVTKFDKSCSKKIEKFYKYKIFEKETAVSSKDNDVINIDSEKSNGIKSLNSTIIVNSTEVKNNENKTHKKVSRNKKSTKRKHHKNSKQQKKF